MANCTLAHLAVERPLEILIQSLKYIQLGGSSFAQVLPSVDFNSYAIESVPSGCCGKNATEMVQVSMKIIKSTK